MKRNTQQFKFRQGDVGLSQIAALPAGAVAVKNEGRIVLAYGEVTGHAHAIAEPEAREFTFAEAGGIVRRFLEVFAKGATVRHEEHSEIHLPAGLYEVIQQREYFPDAIRNVAD